MAEDLVVREQVTGLCQRICGVERRVEVLDTDMAACKAHEESLREKIWERLTLHDVQLARTSVWVAIIVGVVSAVGGGVVSAVVQLYLK